MTMLYDQAVLDALQRGAKRRLLQLGMMGVVLLGGMLALFFARLQLYTSLLTLVGGAWLIFWWDMWARADVLQRKKARELYAALSHEETLSFAAIEPDKVVRDGLTYVRWVLADDEGDERFLYWNLRFAQPDIAQGTRVKLLRSGNDIMGYALG